MRKRVFRVVSQLDPTSPNAYNSLGNVLRNLGRVYEAIENYEKTLSLNSKHFYALYNLGLSLHDIGDYENAIRNYRKLLDLRPDFNDAYYRIGLAFKKAKFKKYNDELQHLMVSLLDKETLIHPSSVAHAAITFLKQNPKIQNALEQSANSGCLEVVIVSVKTLSKQPLFMKLLSCCPMPDLDVETALMGIRRTILRNIANLTNNHTIEHFQNALAHQCFINEYLFFENKEETKNIKALEGSIEKSFQSGLQPTSNEILCLASYRPLYNYKKIGLMNFQDANQTVIKSQFLNHGIENRLCSEMPVFQKVNNKISLSVKNQYEMNPYPRWITLGLPKSKFY